MGPGRAGGAALGAIGSAMTGIGIVSNAAGFDGSKVTLGFGVHWYLNRKNWDWIEEFPSLLLCSFVASPYGAWHFDLILLLIPTFHRAAAFANEGWSVRSKSGLILFAGMNVAMFAMTRFELSSFCYCWVASLTLLGYAFTGLRTQPRAVVQPA